MPLFADPSTACPVLPVDQLAEASEAQPVSGSRLGGPMLAIEQMPGDRARHCLSCV